MSGYFLVAIVAMLGALPPVMYALGKIVGQRDEARRHLSQKEDD